MNFKQCDLYCLHNHIQRGMVYFGDGNWGVPLSNVPLPEAVTQTDGDRMAITGTKHHFWRVSISNNGNMAEFTAIDETGAVLDTITWTYSGSNVFAWNDAEHPLQ